MSGDTGVPVLLEASNRWDPAPAPACDLSDLEGVWEGAYARGEDAWLALELTEGGLDGQTVGWSEIEVFGQGACLSSLTCLPSNEERRVVGIQVEERLGSVLGCLGGVYLLQASDDGARLDVQLRYSLDGPDLASQTLTRRLE